MTGQSHEIIHCPNCKEDVPKTLYCLNCGYPLYKLEKQKTEEEQEKAKEQKIVPQEEVDMSVEIEPPDPISLIEEIPPEVKEVAITEIEAEIETPIYVEEEPILEEEPEIETPIYVEEEPILEEEPEIETPIYLEHETTLQAEPETSEIEQISDRYEDVEYEEPVQKDIIEPEKENDFFSPEKRGLYTMNDISIEFAPDPLTKEVIESLAKNITLKIRLVKLLRENQVKEETFEKLFDSYVEQGRLWVSRRDETIGRFETDIDRMEGELVSARKDFELLEIRKNIGDASDQEYSVKAPAFKWDIENLDKEIKNTRGGIQYVINLKGLVPDQEIADLRSMGDNNFSELDEIVGASSETISRIKDTLSDALNILES
jgi:hypothetical protein